MVTVNAPADSSRTKPAAAAAIFLTSACAVGLALTPNPLVSGVGILLAFVLLTVLVHRSERAKWGRQGHASPLALYSIGWTVFFGIIGLASLRSAEHEPRVNFERFATVRSLLVAFASLLLVSAGYLLVSRHRVTSRVSPLKPYVLKVNVVVIILGVGWCCRLLRFQQAAIGYDAPGLTGGVYQSVLTLGDSLLRVGLALLAYGVWSTTEGIRTQDRCRFLLWAALPPLLFTGLASGFKAQLLTDFAPVTIMYFLCRGRLPWKPVLLLFLYVALILPGVEQYREDVASGVIGEDERGLVDSFSQIFPRVSGGIVGSSPLALTTRVTGHAVTEFSGINLVLAAILEKTPDEVPYLGIQRLLLYPFVFLPVQQLLGGNEMPIGQYVNVNYLGGTTRSSFSPTQPGEFYLSGGWPALIVGELMIGMLLGFLWRATGTHRSRRRWVLYGLLAPFLMNAGLEYTTLVRAGLQAALVFAVVLRFAFQPAELEEVIGSRRGAKTGPG